jgi:hypothetical protein
MASSNVMAKPSLIQSRNSVSTRTAELAASLEQPHLHPAANVPQSENLIETKLPTESLEFSRSERALALALRFVSATVVARYRILGMPVRSTCGLPETRIKLNTLRVRSMRRP